MAQKFCKLSGFEVCDAKARIYNNVQEMKEIDNLTEGDIIKTAGYHSANDGGMATYKIRAKTENDIQENGAIHFINNDLVAELVAENNCINVDQFGTIGDGETNDTIPFQNACNYAREKELTLYAPNKKYLLDSINFIMIPKVELNCEIVASNDDNIYLFDYDNSGAAPDIKINKIMRGVIKMLGLNSAVVNITRAYKLLLTTESGGERRHNFIGYSTFILGFVNQVELYPTEELDEYHNWVNENYFTGGRIANLYIHSDSNFAPEGNVFSKCMSEDTNFNIEKGYNNIFRDIRTENLQNITCSEDAYGNAFYRNWDSRAGTTMRAKENHYIIKESYEDKINLGNANKFEMNKSTEKIAFSINKYNNPANLSTTGTKNENLIASGTNNAYKSSIVPYPDTAFGLTFINDNKNFKYIIQLYDASGNLITADPGVLFDSPMFAWDSSLNGYVNGANNTYGYWCSFKPSANVKYMRIIVNACNEGVKGFADLKCYFNYYKEPKWLHYILKGLDTYSAS